MVDDNIRLLVVESRSHSGVADELLRGAAQAIEAQGAAYDVITVSSALQIPTAIAIAEEAGHRPVGVRYDGYVALGCVIRGETYHFELVANESGSAVTRIGLDHGIPIANAILTVENETQAWARAEPKGRDAARVAVEMANLLKDIA